jgi:hypothetical protein
VPRLYCMTLVTPKSAVLSSWLKSTNIYLPIQILVRMEQEQKVTEDARIAAERDAVEQKYIAHLIQEKYEATMTSLSEMEKRAVMAETMLEATKQYQAGQVKAVQTFAPKSPHADLGKTNQDNEDTTNRKIGLLSRGLGWLEKSKGKPNSAETTEGELVRN